MLTDLSGWHAADTSESAGYQILYPEKVYVCSAELKCVEETPSALLCELGTSEKDPACMVQTDLGIFSLFCMASFIITRTSSTR